MSKQPTFINTRQGPVFFAPNDERYGIYLIYSDSRYWLETATNSWTDVVDFIEKCKEKNKVAVADWNLNRWLVIDGIFLPTDKIKKFEGGRTLAERR